jgi:DNA-binding NtrC family response regulator
MPLHLQAKLLRALESREIRRVGGEATVTVDVRILAATNRDLEDAVAAKQFRKDLFYRLNVVSLKVPPLRERVDDVPELAASYIQYLAPRIGSPACGISAEALELLCGYDWPGNVRELINVIERALLLCEGRTIIPADLPQGIAPAYASPHCRRQTQTADEKLLSKPLKKAGREVLESFERSYISRLLASEKGLVGKAARKAGIDPRTLFAKMKHYGLKKEQFRGADAE